MIQHKYQYSDKNGRCTPTLTPHTYLLVVDRGVADSPVDNQKGSRINRDPKCMQSFHVRVGIVVPRWSISNRFSLKLNDRWHKIDGIRGTPTSTTTTTTTRLWLTDGIEPLPNVR